jgi:acetyl esterase/lipase
MRSVFAGLVFTYGVLAVFLTVNALRRPSPPSSRFPPLWLPAMLTSELPAATVLLRLLIAVAALLGGLWGNPVGRAGLLLIAVSTGLMIPIFGRRRSALERMGTTDHPRPVGIARVSGRHELPADLALDVDIPYHDDLTLDIYRLAKPPTTSPVLIYLHGGSWTGGSPHRQAQSLFHRLARDGWRVAAIRYPLSPAATFPAHLIGVHRSIEWVKRQPWADPSRVVLAGGSAGGHLAALAALTAGEERFRPGFEEADTSVAACVPIYGIYDFLNRNRTRWDWPVIPLHVMKTTKELDPAAYRDASPIDHVKASAPPFLVVHGEYDSLVPPAEAHHFVEALRAAGVTVTYLEVAGAQHAFDAFNTRRSRAVANYVAAHLGELLTGATPGPGAGHPARRPPES